MKLKDKIKTTLECVQNTCVKITVLEHSADFHAQEFADWCIKNDVRFSRWNEDGKFFCYKDIENDFSLYSLLQIFKTENEI